MIKKVADNKYRNHSCGELRLKDIGKEVVLAGWVASIRKLGGITFVLLRDHYGYTQLVCDNEKLLDGVTKESVVTVSGKVIERQSKNNKMPTGDIEVVISKLVMLGKCTSALPFDVENSADVKEETRLKYRYLNLRNLDYQKNIILRSDMLQFVRTKMRELGFVEIQTPLLTSSSPEGARDYIVPTINSLGEFFVLPQAPQQFKQLLMVSGIDKYFQIAPCFRNEAARADRTPGEFYQIDFEMSFATQEEVFAVAEELALGIYTEFTKFELTKSPFPRIAYNTAIENYASDKPDLRNPLLVKDLTKYFINSQFSAFANKTVKAICAPTGEQPRKFYDELTKFVIDAEGKGLAWFKVDENKKLVGSAVKFLNNNELSAMEYVLKYKTGDSIFVIADASVSKCTKLIGSLRNELGLRLKLIDNSKVAFCWIVDFPFYEKNDETGEPEFAHNPFSMPQGGMESLKNKNVFDIKAYQYDLVCNGYEMLSGAVRNHDREIMVKAFEIAGYSKEIVENKFPALFNAFSYGAPPHAGAAFGFDRMIMPIIQTDNIRDVITFPFTKSGKDLMMGAPSSIDEKTLRELGLKLIK